MMIAALAMFGCSGDDGARGPVGVTGVSGTDGTDGTDGAVGAAGPVTHTNESCNVCHGEDREFTIAWAHTDQDPDPALTVTITGVTQLVAGASSTLSFTVADAAAAAVTGIELEHLRLYLAYMTPGAAGDPGMWTRWAYERDSASYPTGILVDNADGSYDYVFLTEATAAAVAAASGRAAVYVRNFGDYARKVVTYDFDATAAMAVVAASGREIVAIADCNVCHSDLGMHGGGYRDTKMCVICHSSSDADRLASGTSFEVMIHQVHAEIEAEAIYTIDEDDPEGPDISEITYPENNSNCEKCHLSGAEADNWKDVPNILACGSCHTDVDFADAATHAGGVQASNAACALCHTPAAIVTAHTATTLLHDDAVSSTVVYTSAIALSADADADGVYEAGEEILVTVTVAGVTGEYTDDEDVSFSNASLYVYGPRAEAVPVLTVDSTTDPDYIAALALDSTETPDQGRSMFVGADDQVETDADGFKYQLLAIPAGMASGTYMIQARISHDDSRTTGSRSYPIDGWSLTTFQVGTATEEDKVAGDGCANCHEYDAVADRYPDWGTMNHRSYFGTDGCLACHDQSGNHANPIANRVHALHSAQAEDYLGKDFSDVTYPQDIENCVTCHTEGDSYVTEPAAWGIACLGCHADKSGARDHMMQNGAPFEAH